MSLCSAMAWPYKNGLSVEPGCLGASTASTSSAWLSTPDDPTQASTWPVALSSTRIAPSCTLLVRSSCKCWFRVSTAKRCSGALSVVRRLATPCGRDAAILVSRCSRSAMRLKCGAMPLLASKARFLSATSVKNTTASQSTEPAPTPVPARMSLRTPQARCPTCEGRAFGARTSAAATAASRSSSPCGALSNKVRESASMPTISPRNGTRFR
ncbi:hypothetical protein D3C72_1006090 [compost metagenome]